MAESTTTVIEASTMNTISGLNSSIARAADHSFVDANSANRSNSPKEDMSSDDTELATPIVLASHNTSMPLKGAKNNIMLGATPMTSMPHPLSMSSDNNSLHHFQTESNSFYSHTNSAFIHAALGSMSSHDSSNYPMLTVPSSATAAFMAMHGHNTSLYEPPRRNSVPTLTVDQAEHKRKVSSEEKTLQRQASWSSFSSSSRAMSVFPSARLSGLHHQLETTHVDPTMVHYYRTHFSHPHGLQQSHSFNQALPSTTNSSACPSPMPESFMPGSVLNNINSIDDVLPRTETGGVKAKRNNSICSTTSMSSTGSGSNNNKHPCKFPTCGWSFKRYEHLKRHMLVHSKERPFICDFTNCNKSFSRSDNFSAHLRTHSKKGSEHRQRSSRALESSEAAIKQESLDPPLSSSSSHDLQNLESDFVHQSNDYESRSMSQEPSESGRDRSPSQSPISTHIGHSSSIKGEDAFGMMSHSGYSFGGNTMYSMDPLESLNSMVPRFDTIRLDLKSVAPSDIHKQPNEDDSHSHVLLSAGNPNGDSPHPSPIPHYEHFTFPSSISTHFMPMLHGGFPLDHTGLHQQHHMQHTSMHDTTPTTSYASLPSADSSVSSTSSLHHSSYHPENGFQFTNAVHNIGSELQYPPASPMNEDGPIHPLHPHTQFHHQTHLDFYDTKVANPQMLHHSFPNLHASPSASLPPHPLMSISAFSTPGLNEPLYSPSPLSSSTSSSIPGSRGATTTSDNINGNTTNNNAITTPSSSSGSSSGNSGGSSSKHGGSGKHHTCSIIGCSKRFKRLEHLKRHIKTHTLERPFSCTYETCTKRFSRSDNLAQHHKTHQRQIHKLQMKHRNQAQAQAQQSQQVQ